MSNVFSFTGRVRRSEYLITQVVVSVVGAILFFIFGVSLFAGGDAVGVSLLIFFVGVIVLSWAALASGTKRCHDRGNSGLYQLIPFYGLWMMFGDGELGTNRYGADPKGRMSQGDYVQQTQTAATEHNAVV
jgi:uncharacterized membrane protein YhaH (DUF805 family)